MRPEKNDVRSAPEIPPYYFDSLGGREEGLEPQASARLLVDALAQTAETFPAWRHDDLGAPIRLSVRSYLPGVRAVIGYETGGMDCEVEVSPHRSGWVVAVATIAGREVFRAYLHQPYEEYELWPAGAQPLRDAEPPGRMSKRRLWISLQLSGWPELAGIANEAGWVNLSYDEAGPQQTDNARP